jgi:hypothetical protein
MATVLPPNQFNSGASPSPPDEAAASSRSHAPGAAAEFEGIAQTDTSHIGEIFAGARKLEQIPGIFDQAAYTPADELAYVELKLRDDPYAADLIEIPAGMWLEFDPAPLFIQQQMRA